MYKKIVGILICICFIGASFVSMIVTEVQADDTRGLLGYWSFNDGTANDDSGNSNHGTIYGGAAFIPNGGPDGSGCLSFDGINDYIIINDVTDFVFVNQDVSFCCWVTILDNSNDYRQFIYLCGTDDSEPSIMLEKCRSGIFEGRVILQQRNTLGEIGTSKSIQDGNSLPKDTWMFLVGVVDYPNTITLYINSIFQQSVSAFDYNLSQANNLELVFGWSSYDQGWGPHYGKIDEVRIYDNALSQSEIISLYNQGGGNQQPVANANGPYNANTDENINLDGTGSTDNDGFIFSYEWDLDNDGTFDDASGATPSWSWSTGGSYPISLKVTDDDGAIDTDGSTVYINEFPVADADGPYYGNISETLILDGSGSFDSDGSIVSYAWDLDDDGTYDDSSGVTPSWSWSESGTYTIGLRVTDDDGASDTDTADVFVELDEYPPIASFTYSPEEPKVGDTVSFDASISSDPDGSIVSFSWDFGDDTTGTGMIINHMYSEPARFSVALTVFDNDGNFDTASMVIEVGVEGDLPVAYFTFSPDSPCVNETVLFDASSSFSPVGVIESYVWDFGDSTNGIGMVINHTYSECGNFSVNLSVFDNRGFNDSFIKIICINLSQVPNIIIEEISGSFGISVNITNTGTGTADKVSWSIDVDADFGFILSGKHTENVINELVVGGSKTIKSSGLRGIGFITITVHVADVVKKATGFLLGPLVLRVNEL